MVRSTVAGSKHRYLISRSETSATFDAHITRLRASPHKTFGVVALESRVSDGQGSGRGFHEMDPSIVFEIDRILELNDKEALISFVGNEINARWVTRAEMAKQGLGDLIADYLDAGFFANADAAPKFTMSQTVVARLENKRTHDSFNRQYHTGEWLDECPTCGKVGVQGNALLMCSFCPNAYHFGCLGMDVRQRAQKGNWQCPPCRARDDLTRLDERPRKQPRLARRAALAESGRSSTAVLPRDRPQRLGEPAPPAGGQTDFIEPPPSTPSAIAPRGRGRPRKAVSIAAVPPEIVSAAPQGGQERQPAAVTPSAAPPLPHSRTTRHGSVAHGVGLTAALPKEARMLMVREADDPYSEVRYYRHVQLTTTRAEPTAPRRL